MNHFGKVMFPDRYALAPTSSLQRIISALFIVMLHHDYSATSKIGFQLNEVYMQNAIRIYG